MLVPAIPPDGMRGLHGADRVVIVEAPTRHTTHATARAYIRNAFGSRPNPLLAVLRWLTPTTRIVIGTTHTLRARSTT